MSPEQNDPFEALEPKDRPPEHVLRYLRWGLRHPHLLTALWFGTTVLLFVVFWQLFGLVVGVIALVLSLLVQLGLWVSVRNAARQ